MTTTTEQELEALREAAVAFADKKIGYSGGYSGEAWLPPLHHEHRHTQCVAAFIAGAEWQRKQQQITYQGMTFDVIGDCHNAVDPHSKILFIRPTAGLSERVEAHNLDSVDSTPTPASKYGYAPCTIDREALLAAGKDCDALQAIIEQRFIDVNKALMESAQAEAFNDGTGQLEEEEPTK